MSLRRVLAVLVLAAPLLACGGGSSAPPPSPNAMRDGKVPVTLVVKSLEGKSLDLASLRGKVVLVDIWATWCGPCRITIPHLVSISKWKPDDVVVVGILTADAPENLRTFQKQVNMPYFVGLANAASDSIFATDGLPTLFVLDRQGRMVDHVVGAAPEAELRRRIEAHL